MADVPSGPSLDSTPHYTILNIIHHRQNPLESTFMNFKTSSLLGAAIVAIACMPKAQVRVNMITFIFFASCFVLLYSTLMQSSTQKIRNKLPMLLY
jgi:hypothetical protein